MKICDCMQVEEEVLKDPFKKAIPADSKLLAYSAQSDKDNKEVESPSLTPVERAGVIGGSVTLVAILLYCIHRNTSWRPWNTFIPNLKRFSAYYGPVAKKTGRKSESEDTQKAAEVRATPPPDQLALLSSAV